MEKIKKNKILIIFILFILITITFSGCAQVRTMTITNQDGSIEEQVFVSLDSKAIVEAGYEVEDIKDDISSTAVNEAKDMINKLNQKLDYDIFNATTETRQILNTFKNGIVVLSNNWENNEYVVSVKFKNIDVYRYYYGITEEPKIEYQTEEYFFYNKVSFSGSTMFMKHKDLYDRLNLKFSIRYMGLINSESNELLYTYKTDLHRQHSNADYITKLDGEYYHTWVVEDIENEEILFHYNVANSGNGILIAIGISLVACG
ncbi:MAG: hypothetical protein J6Q13_01805, partial [Clostridia bacterium]|nr:hypothetical protein [Clostridia bacterium]